MEPATEQHRGLTPEFAESLIASIFLQYGKELRLLGVEPDAHPASIDPDVSSQAWGNVFVDAGKLFPGAANPKEAAQREICSTWARGLQVLPKNHEHVRHTQGLFGLKRGFIPNEDQLVRLTSGLPLKEIVDADDAYLFAQIGKVSRFSDEALELQRARNQPAPPQSNAAGSFDEPPQKSIPEPVPIPTVVETNTLTEAAPLPEENPDTNGFYSFAEAFRIAQEEKGNKKQSRRGETT